MTQTSPTMTPREHTLTLPKNDGTHENLVLTSSVIFVGANGSGKTRLGSWIENDSQQKSIVHRVSAQRSLQMPESTTPNAVDIAKDRLLFSRDPSLAHIDSAQAKKSFKWQQKPAIFPQQDFTQLMEWLFSEEIQQNAEYKKLNEISTERLKNFISKLDQIKDTWENILPHRELVIDGLRIQTKVKSSQVSQYNSSEMSDGERVIFYLIGQCLAAPQDGIIVIDEPELHLHKSVQMPLWNAIEKLRSDCLFVYLTHDVDFAAAHEIAEKIWLKSFDGQVWDWEKVQKDQNLPDALLLELLGSRKSVVFVEGENGSHDVTLYRELLEDFLIVPRGSCTQVIQSVKALKANKQFHHLEILGIVDRDRRVSAEISALENDGIFVLDVAEVENLFCTQEVLALVSKQLCRKPEEDFTKVSDFVFLKLQSELEHQISLRAVSEIKFQFNDRFAGKSKGSAGINTELQNVIQGMDAEKIYTDYEQEFNQLMTSKNYQELLRLYNRKSLPSQIGSCLDLGKNSLPDLVIRMVKGSQRAAIKTALKSHFGAFASRIV
jgi:ABC-type dipeptide/oligopeptide/nickel transport system ATPase subunit